VWQGKDLRKGVFGSVAMIGLAGEFSEVWQGKNLGGAKGVGGAICLQERERTGRKDIGGLRGTAGREDMVRGARGRQCRLNETIITYWYSMSRITLSALYGAG
jgi:hypothetical protein